MVNPTIFSSIAETFSQANTVTGNLFWSGVVVALWFTFFLKFKQFDFLRAAVGASSITVIFSLLFYLLGLVGLPAILIPLFIAVIGGAVL